MLRKWVTEFRALDAKTGDLKTWGGPHVEGISFNDAQEWCYRNAGHLKVIGELISEIPCKEGSYDPDWRNIVDYEKINLN